MRKHRGEKEFPFFPAITALGGGILLDGFGPRPGERKKGDSYVEGTRMSPAFNEIFTRQEEERSERSRNVRTK